MGCDNGEGVTKGTYQKGIDIYAMYEVFGMNDLPNFVT